MKQQAVFIEPPKAPGEEMEFFAQSNVSYTVACQAHIHSAVELLYVKEGRYRVLLDDSEYVLGEGDLILFCSNAIHHVETLGEAKNTYYVIKASPLSFVNFLGCGAGCIMRFAIHRQQSRCFWSRKDLAGSEIELILKGLLREHEQKAFASEVAVTLKIMELMLAIAREDADEATPPDDALSERIYRAMRYVQTHFAEDVDEKRLASELGMSYSYFSRSFKLVTGMTFKAYLNRTRVNKAEQLLFLGRHTVSEVAISCGYNSVSYFISVFRAVKGRTPYKLGRQACSER